MSTKHPVTRPIQDEDLSYIRSRYQDRIAQHGVTFASMNSGTEAKQRIRHTIHAELVSPTDQVFDVGSGIGAFYQFLRDHGHRGSYHGIDIIPEYVEHCVRAFPTARFDLRDVFDQGIPGEHDVIVASQVFNAKYRRSDNLEVLKQFLAMAFDKTRKSVTLDMLTSYADFNAPELYYFSPEQVFAFAKSLTRFVRIRHEYLPFEFSIQLFKHGMEPVDLFLVAADGLCAQSRDALGDNLELLPARSGHLEGNPGISG